MERYHLRRSDREIRDDAVLRSVLREGKYTILGLCRDSEPYVVTLNYGYDAGRNVMYFHCAPDGFKIDFLKANSSVCATVIEDLGYCHGECDHAYRTIVVRGSMAIVEDPAEKRHAVGVLIDHLERDPGPVHKRYTTPGQAERIDRMGILRLDIVSITGKESRP